MQNPPALWSTFKESLCCILKPKPLPSSTSSLRKSITKSQVDQSLSPSTNGSTFKWPWVSTKDIPLKLMICKGDLFKVKLKAIIWKDSSPTRKPFLSLLTIKAMPEALPFTQILKHFPLLKTLHNLIQIQTASFTSNSCLMQTQLEL